MHSTVRISVTLHRALKRLFDIGEAGRSRSRYLALVLIIDVLRGNGAHVLNIALHAARQLPVSILRAGSFFRIDAVDLASRHRRRVDTAI